MANRTKLLKKNAPELTTQENLKTKFLWGTAGRLDGLEVVGISGTGPYTITMNPGAYVHDGVAVYEAAEFSVAGIVSPSSWSLTVPLYLVVQANGNDENQAPLWFVTSKTAYEAQPDFKNYAAVIARYDYKLPVNLIEQRVLIGEHGTTNDFDAYSDNGVTPIAASLKNDVLNGSVGAEARIRGEIDAPDAFEIYNLDNITSTQVNAVRSMTLEILCAASTTGATVGTGTVTVGGAVPTIGDVFSIIFNGIEVSFTAAAATLQSVSNGLTAAINAAAASGGLLDGVVATATNGGGTLLVITITSSKKGRAGLLDLSTAEDSATTTLTPAAFTGGNQAYFAIDFPTTDSTSDSSVILPMTVYPDVIADDSSTANFSLVELQLDANGISKDTFNSMKMRLELLGAATTFIDIASINLSIGYSESSEGIDAFPPNNLSHWSAFGSVSVGGGTNSESGHRLAKPIDHPNRSVIREKIALGAVGVAELDAKIIGAFTPHTHVTNDNDPVLGDPGAVVGDFNLHELSDLAKDLSDNLQSNFGKFAVDHDTVTTGHHKSVSYAGRLAGGASDVGTVVLAVTSGENAAAAGVTPSGDTTQAMVHLVGSSVPNSAILYTRTANMGSEAAVQVVGLTSKALAGTGNAAGTEAAFEVGISAGASHRLARFGRTSAGAVDLYGVSSLDGIPVESMAGGGKALFSGVVGFMRYETNPSVPFQNRVLSQKIHADQDTFWNTGITLDAAGVLRDKATSRNSNPNGYMVYGKGGRTHVVHNGSVSMTMPNGGGAGSFPAATPAYLYLPFVTPGANPFTKIVVTLSGPILTYSSQPAGYREVWRMACEAYPAYDAKTIIGYEAAYALTAVTAGSAGASPNTDIYPASTGVVRRFPWVLTPDGYERRVGIYYDNADFLVGSPAARAATFGPNPPLSDAFTTNPLPYYDTIDPLEITTTTHAKGVVFSLNQGASGVAAGFRVQDVNYPFVGDSASIQIELDMLEWNQAGYKKLTVAGAPANTLYPSGIVVALSHVDSGFGLAADALWANWNGPVSVTISGVSSAASTYSLTAP